MANTSLRSLCRHVNSLPAEAVKEHLIAMIEAYDEGQDANILMEQLIWGFLEEGALTQQGEEAEDKEIEKAEAELEQMLRSGHALELYPVEEE